ncbi:MAG: hypothetical protein WAT39_21530 [Planctomycetota bacterium]
MKAPLRWLLAALFLCVHENVRAQAGGAIRGPAAVVQGGTIDVDVASGDASVQVSSASGTTSHPVPPGGRVSIPVPPVPAGTLLFVMVGRGRRMSVILIEVLSP